MTRSSLEMTASSSTSSCSASIKISVRSHSHCHRKGTVAADVARILDPSYSPPSSPRRSYSGSSHTTKPSSLLISAYVDHYGDLHDPDYRYFPAVSLDDEHDAEEDFGLDQWAPEKYASERKRRLTEASATSHYYSTHDNNYGYSGSLPSSSPIREEKRPHHHLVKRQHSLRASSPSSSPSSPYSLSSSLTTEEDESSFIHQSTTSLPHIDTPSLVVPTVELTRTTSTPDAAPAPAKHHHSLKRQWQAVSLRVRFGMFRAGKRWGMV